MLDSFVLFNKKFEEFLNDLIDTYPDENELKTMKNMLDWTIKYMGSKVLQEMFNLSVAIPYSDRIIQKDESFFLEECEYDPQYADINIINKLKNRWKQLSEENRTVVWKYMLVLLVLNHKCGGHAVKI
jgi:hypothetical protein